MQLLERRRIKFLIGGAYALGYYTGHARDTKDFDLMLRPKDVPSALRACQNAGYEAKFVFTHWLAKVWSANSFVDIIFHAGNGLGEVDDVWFSAAPAAEIFGIAAKIAPAEELIWQKAFIMERERFDGADIIHLLASCAVQINWKHLIERFGPDWRVLMSHLILFGFAFPSKRDLIPTPVIEELSARLGKEVGALPPAQPLCNRDSSVPLQYLSDITSGGFIDTRTIGRGVAASSQRKSRSGRRRRWLRKVTIRFCLPAKCGDSDVVDASAAGWNPDYRLGWRSWPRNRSAWRSRNKSRDRLGCQDIWRFGVANEGSLALPITPALSLRLPLQ